MARNRREEVKEDPARITEIDREEVELKRPTLVNGEWVRAGDSREVYPFQRRHMVDAGHVEGDVEDIASEAEKAQGNLEVLKHPEDREGHYYTEEELWERGDATGSGDDGVVAGEEGSNVSGDANPDNDRNRQSV
jgi:hypothetical protein